MKSSVISKPLEVWWGDASPASLPPVSARACGALGSLQIDIASPTPNQPVSATVWKSILNNSLHPQS